MLKMVTGGWLTRRLNKRTTVSFGTLARKAG